MPKNGSIAAIRQHGFTISKAAISGGPVGLLPQQLPKVRSSAETEATPDAGYRGLFELVNAGSYEPDKPFSLGVMGGRVEVVGTAHPTTGVRRLVKSVIQGLRACQDPERGEEGLGGTYFFMNEHGCKVAIMKPCDEEPLAPNNPKGFVGRALGEPGLKPTVRVGEAAMREVAAYLLDRGHFAHVPDTVLVKLTHPVFHVAGPADPSPPSDALGPPTATASAAASTLHSGVADLVADPAPAARGKVAASDVAGVPCKLGSLQEFVLHDGDTSEIGASRFSPSDVHRIGILDLRLFNTDRHAGNILVRRPRASSAHLDALARLEEGQLELVPIDHGFCLPEALEPPYFEWLHWPQAMMPFDAEELDYIAALDPQTDKELLRQELPSLRQECLRTLEVATTLLQRCAAAGLTLAEIGQVASRPLVGLEDEPSALERICLAARQEVDRQASREAGGEDSATYSDWTSGDDSASSGYGSDSGLSIERERIMEEGVDGALEVSDEVSSPSSPATQSPFITTLQQSQKLSPMRRSMSASCAASGNMMSQRPIGNDSASALGLAGARPLWLPGESPVSGLASSSTEHGSPGSGSDGMASGGDDSAIPRAHKHLACPTHVGEDLLFSFDGDSSPNQLRSSGLAKAADGKLRRRSHPSPMSKSRCCSQTPACTDSGSSTASPFAPSKRPPTPPGMPIAGRCRPDVLAPAPLGMAASVGCQAGVPWLPSAGPHPREVRRRQHARHRAAFPGGGQHHHHGRRGAVYPPPVFTQGPQAMTAVFSGLHADQWAAFMELLEQEIAAELAAGSWKQSGKKPQQGGAMLGQSCPRF